ncbi:MAG: acyl-CoA synthetase [bacterium]|nr:acyl-CoA synthetase [bacterium]
MDSEMLHPRRFATHAPDQPAVIMGRTGEVITYRELDEEANRLAHLLRTRGLNAGDHLAIVSETTSQSMAVFWAAQLAGLIYTPINYHLTTGEIQAVLDDCGAAAVVTSGRTAPVVAELDLARVPVRLTTGTDAPDGFEPVARAAADLPTAPMAGEGEGREMVYSGGTTGRPKGIRKPTAQTGIGDPSNPAVQTALGMANYGVDHTSVYLSPAPLYHSAPLVFCMCVHRVGGTVVLMERFDPADCLRFIGEYRVTHAQFVPTMFSRMLKLPPDVKEAADLSSLRLAIHAAAPCPVEVKQQMIEWWGPILFEYYAGTEDIGHSAITSEEWLAHPGSVGRPLQPVHIVGPDGNEMPAGEVGVVYFDGGRDFQYHNDPERTAAAAHPSGWRTLGDMGRLDEEGYLYLTDRVAHTIISGGVNIYPQEIEDALIMHPDVADVAVIGVPNDDLGEEVRAVVQLVDPARAGSDTESALLAWCAERLAAFKRPRGVDFDESLPRDPNGKLMKRYLRDRYWPTDSDSRIV